VLEIDDHIMKIALHSSNYADHITFLIMEVWKGIWKIFHMEWKTI